MAVTLFPALATYIFGTTAETGIAVESYEQDDVVDEYEQRNNVGEIVEVVTFNPTATITITGESTAALTAILGKLMTVANLITLQCGSGGITICNRVNHSSNRQRNLQVKISAKYRPLVLA
jgi:hypothetical protein